MATNQLKVPVLVLGGGTGGLAAALQCARSGTDCLLVTPGPWLGGMLSSSGVSAPDGNELSAWQTGLWGALLRELRQCIPEGLDHNWVSCFGFQPAQAEGVLQAWVSQASQLQWLPNLALKELRRRGDRLESALFNGGDHSLEVKFELLVDGTELGESLPLADLPFRLGWEAQELWQEPSAPSQARLGSEAFFQEQPVQSPTWVVLGQWQGPWDHQLAPAGLARCLSYGRLPGDLVMLNWPLNGNDWHSDPGAAFSPDPERRLRQQQGMQAHSLNYLESLSQASGGRLGPATAFPGGRCLALQAYWRESRRLIGCSTVLEQDLLPGSPNQNQRRQSIAVGNYPNDHHYPGSDWPLAPKSQPWGGRWSGTPFCIPFGALHGPQALNLLMADKGIAVSHMANGATRLGPLVLNVGQAAGLAAALCQQKSLLPSELPVAELQAALLGDPLAPSGPAPLIDLPWHDPRW
ncbi:MAG: FAD-dependent oxidoreductase, partial [Synechococcaceae bacterium WB9_2_170]|nr:FAD-dependent oxidoreductase [Synechococcaceae bacterium WB9_2_170]